MAVGIEEIINGFVLVMIMNGLYNLHLGLYLGVEQCFGVVYHELTTLRQVYFARAALAGRAK